MHAARGFLLALGIGLLLGSESLLFCSFEYALRILGSRNHSFDAAKTEVVLWSQFDAICLVCQRPRETVVQTTFTV